MKRILSHRGNQEGPNKEKENHPDYLINAINNGFDIELDVWFINNKFYLGHDGPDYLVDEYFFKEKMWIHCKNIEALYALRKNKKSNLFFHDRDDCTLTSKNFIWTYPKNITLTKRSIAVMCELVPEWDLTNCYGVCTDYPKKYLNILKK